MIGAPKPVNSVALGREVWTMMTAEAHPFLTWERTRGGARAGSIQGELNAPADSALMRDARLQTRPFFGTPFSRIERKGNGLPRVTLAA
jgi:hypothetical protein